MKHIKFTIDITLPRGDEGGSWWEVNRVPEFYKNN